MQVIDHIGIAVNTLEKAIETFRRVWQVATPKIEHVDTQLVQVAFFEDIVPKIELLAPTTTSSTIAKFLTKRGEGIHHLAFITQDIEKEIQRLKKEGFAVIAPYPQRGAGGKKVCFLHPKNTHGVLTELCEERVRTNPKGHSTGQ